jgi:hypothetical protein
MTVVTADPAALPAAYDRLLGSGRAITSGEDVVVETGSAPIRFVPPHAFAGRYPGIRLVAAPPPYPAALGFRVRDLAATKRALAGVHTVELGNALCVPPAEACGVLVEFVD